MRPTDAQHAASLAETRKDASDEWAEMQAFCDALTEFRDRIKRRAQFQVRTKDALLGLEAALFDAQWEFTGEAAAALADHSDEALRVCEKRAADRDAKRLTEIEQARYDMILGKVGG